MPTDDRGPAHVHWSLGYRFVDEPDALTAERGRPAEWFPITGLPVDVFGDIRPFLAALVGRSRR